MRCSSMPHMSLIAPPMAIEPDYYPGNWNADCPIEADHNLSWFSLVVFRSQVGQLRARRPESNQPINQQHQCALRAPYDYEHNVNWKLWWNNSWMAGRVTRYWTEQAELTEEAKVECLNYRITFMLYDCNGPDTRQDCASSKIHAIIYFWLWTKNSSTSYLATLPLICF